MNELNLSTLQELLHAKSGPLTQELLRTPSEFGLGQLPSSQLPDATTNMVCGYCSTGCGLKIHLKDGVAINLSPSKGYPVNRGMACPKGWEALTVLDAPDRATTPLLRGTDGKLQPVDWHRAMEEFVSRMKSVQNQHGPESAAFISTGQMVTEEMAYLGALTKFEMGMLHGDGNTRQCMATAVVAYKQAFGFDAPPYTYADFEESDVLVFIGSNLCLAHPILWERVMRNPHDPEIIVVDPRQTETAMNATQHLQVAPKADLSLLYGIAKILIDNDWVDHEYLDAHTNHFEAFKDFVQQFDIDRVAAKTGMTAEQIHQFAKTIHNGKRVSFWWTMGVNQSHQGVRTAQAIINLALMTGNIGKAGTGANSITGQCNAMGSRLFSNTTGLLGGHDFTNPEDRTKVANILKINESNIPDENSLAYHEIMEGILKGKIKALWIVCTNTAHSWINQNQARDILSRLDFLVVQDMYHSTETARLADLVLPAAGWAEKEGTFINSERRIGRVKKVRHAPGEALSDFNIFRLITKYWTKDNNSKCGDLFDRWASPEAVFHYLKEITRGTPCDITGIDNYEMLDEAGGIQWPCSEHCDDDTSSEKQLPAIERRLFSDGKFHHADQRAKFLFEAPRPLSEPAFDRYPFTLLTGRGSASQWHTQTRTSKSAVLRKLYPNDPFVEISPTDARRLGIQENDLVEVTSQRGSMTAMAFLTHSVSLQQIFIPMHYKETNKLTDSVFDPYSKQPAYKACAVSVRLSQRTS